MKVAAIQLTSSESVDENLSMTKDFIQEAADQGALLVVLPEMFAMVGHSSTIKEKFGQGKIQDFLSSQAKLNNIWIVGGTIPLICEKTNKVRASCLVYDNQGQVLTRYDKMHLF